MDVTSSSRAASAPERSRRETRERLVSAGTRLFSERGLHDVTSHEIARTAGVAAGTFYLHFKDKTALFREVVSDAVLHLRARFERARATARTPEDDARNRAAEILAFAEERRALVHILFGRDGEAASVAADLLEDFAAGTAAALADRIAAGEASPAIHPEVAAEALVGMRARVAAWWAERPGRAPREAVIETLAQLELAGVWRSPAFAPSPSAGASQPSLSEEERQIDPTLQRQT